MPAPKGGRWGPLTLTGEAAPCTGILRRTLYKGVVTYNRRHYRTHPETGQRIVVLRKPEEWIGVPAPELAIVEEDLFEAAQQQLAARSERRATRVRQNAVLTEEERTARVAAYERQRQAGQREAMPRGVAAGKKLLCTAHDKPMRTIRSRLYNCPARNCPNRNLDLDRDLMPLVLESLYGFDADAELSDLSRFDEWRKALEEQVEVQSRELERERDEIGHALDALGRKRKLQNVAPWFEERERRVRCLAHEIGEAEEHLRLTAPVGPGGRVVIARAYRIELARLVMDDGPGPPFLVGTRGIRPWVERFRLTAQWDEDALPGPDGSRWKRSVETEYDLYELLKALRPGKRRSR